MGFVIIYTVLVFGAGFMCGILGGDDQIREDLRTRGYSDTGILKMKRIVGHVETKDDNGDWTRENSHDA